MRNATRHRFRFAIQTLAAAWFIAWMGLPSARGDQTANCTPNPTGIHAWQGFADHGPWPTTKPWTTTPWPNKPWPTIPWTTKPCPSDPQSTNPGPTDPWSSHTPCSRPSSDSPISASAADSPLIQLGGAALTGTTSLGTTTISGSTGSYTAQTITVTGPASTAGAWTVDGFNPTNDKEIYGLATNLSGTALTSLIAELNSAVGGPDPGATVTTVPSNLATVLAGDNIAVIFPNNGVAAPNIFSYNLTNGPAGAAITSITVVPEPAIAGTLILGVVGFAGQRKRRRIP